MRSDETKIDQGLGFIRPENNASYRRTVVSTRRAEHPQAWLPSPVGRPPLQKSVRSAGPDIIYRPDAAARRILSIGSAILVGILLLAWASGVFKKSPVGACRPLTRPSLAFGLDTKILTVAGKSDARPCEPRRSR